MDRVGLYKESTTEAGQLTGGEKQRLALARVMLMDPEVMVQINLTEIMRLCIGASYRFMFLFDALPGLDSFDFSAPAGIVQFRFLAL
jgi:ABC-type ATPase involved in cell division